MESNGTGNLSLSIFVCNTICRSFLPRASETDERLIELKGGGTFVRTAIDEYELPKLMPTTVGIEVTSIGASAVPFCLGVEVMEGEEERMDCRSVLACNFLAEADQDL